VKQKVSGPVAAIAVVVVVVVVVGILYMKYFNQPTVSAEQLRESMLKGQAASRGQMQNMYKNRQQGAGGAK
jgi:hypothetical protein